MFDPNEAEEILDQAFPLPSEKVAPGAEAPASATIHVWDKDNYGCMFTIRDTNDMNLYVRVQATIARFKRDGWKPDWKTEGSTTPPSTQKAVVESPTTPKPPMCGVHGTPMTLKPAGISKSTGKPYPAFWSCGQRDGSNYCKFRV